jgi:exodeoxyribonuclease-3
MSTAAATLLRRSTAQESASQGRMLVASWNVNSFRARIHHVKGWLSAHQPDVLLLQEPKGSEFPEREFKELGYDSAAVTQKAYNGSRFFRAVLSESSIRP